MQTVIFKGEAKNIGRFGWVEKDTILILTDHEYAGVKGSKEFAVSKSEPKDQSPALAKENEHDRIISLELKEKTAAQLQVIIEEMNKDGANIQVGKNAPKSELIFHIQKAEKAMAQAEAEKAAAQLAKENAGTDPEK